MASLQAVPRDRLRRTINPASTERRKVNARAGLPLPELPARTVASY
jgi:hypothetical protein